jgi:hypothetical protein
MASYIKIFLVGNYHLKRVKEVSLNLLINTTKKNLKHSSWVESLAVHVISCTILLVYLSKENSKLKMP